MSKLFLWLSGVSPDLLSKCTLLESERTRFTGMGTLVLIPAALGFASMTYAISTVTTKPTIFIGGGILWFLIVLMIDRYIVSTLFKSSVTPMRAQFLTWSVRFLLAIFIGIAVSHPFVLYYFRDSIDQRIGINEQRAIDQRVKQGEDRRRYTSTSNAEADLRAAIARRDCQQQLLTAEQSGIAVELPGCGWSSGIPECRNRCHNILAQIDVLTSEIEMLSQTVREDRDRMQRSKEAMDSALATEVAHIRQQTSFDYLARVDALAEIEHDKPHVTQVKWFILLIFVLIDLLPVTMKLATPAGEYEQRRDTMLKEAMTVQEAEREVLGTLKEAGVYQNLKRTRSNYESWRDEASALTNTTVAFIRDLEHQRDLFESSAQEVRERIDRIRDHETKTRYEGFIPRSRQLFIDAWHKSMTRFRAYLESL